MRLNERGVLALKIITKRRKRDGTCQQWANSMPATVFPTYFYFRCMWPNDLVTLFSAIPSLKSIPLISLQPFFFVANDPNETVANLATLTCYFLSCIYPINIRPLIIVIMIIIKLRFNRRQTTLDDDTHRHAFLFLWPWPWLHDLGIWLSPRYSKDVSAFQKWIFCIKGFKS